MAYGGEPPVPTFIIRVSVFLLFAVFLCTRTRIGFSRPFLDLSVAVFVLYAIVATAWAAYPWAAYQQAWNILCVVLVYFLVRSLNGEGGGEREPDRVLAAILIAAAFQVALELLQRGSGRGGGLWGSFANSNHLADYLFFGMVASLYFGWKGKAGGIDGRKILCFAMAALMGYGIYLTKSRAMAAVAAGVSLFLILTARGSQRRLYLAGTAFGGALLLASVASRLIAPLDPYAFSRLNIWKAAWKTAISHPFGVGLGGYKFYWLRFREPLEGALFRFGKIADTAHSHFFGILSELGFPGAFLAVAIACAVLVLAWREGRREDRILPLCLIPLGATIHAFFDVNMEPLGNALPVAVCAALLAGRNVRGGRNEVSLSPVLRTAPLLVLLLCFGYSAATCIGYIRYSAGLEALKQGDTNAAMRGFSSAETLDPLNSAYPDAVSSVHYRWYLRTRRAEYLAAAVNAEQRAVGASREDSLHLSQAGFLLGELAETVAVEEQRRALRDFSLSALDESLRKNPYGVVALMRRAEVLRRSGKMEEARAALEKVIALEPNAVIAYPMLARLDEAENPERAAERYRMAIARSGEFEGLPLEPWQRELLRVDVREIERRIDALERGHFPSPAGGQ